MGTYLDGSINPFNILKCLKHNADFRKEHPEYFDPDGLMVFCGPQGSGKTLSAVQYVKRLCQEYPKAILCTNVEIKGLNPITQVIVYDGLDCIKNLENGYAGVIYLIDEIHLEFNSLESKNIPIEVMVEVSQQRKQRKHIVGTSQVYGRLAKPFREQIKTAVLCSNYFHFLQVNKEVDSTRSEEVDGKLVAPSGRTHIWFHSPALYDCYDTYVKMHRYRQEWQGRPIMNI